MIKLISENIAAIERICRDHHVKSLFLFGSAITDNFEYNSSDLDFLVEFNGDVDLFNYADNFFSLLDSFKLLFNRDIDLLTARSLKNEIIIAEINKSKVQLYAA